MPLIVYNFILNIKIIANVIITYRVTHKNAWRRFDLNYEFKLNSNSNLFMILIKLDLINYLIKNSNFNKSPIWLGHRKMDLSLYINILKSQIRVRAWKRKTLAVWEKKMEIERRWFSDASTSLLQRSSVRVDTDRA